MLFYYSDGSVVATMVMEFESSATTDLSDTKIAADLQQAVQSQTFGREFTIDEASITVQRYVGMF